MDEPTGTISHGTFDINDLDQERFASEENPEGHCTIEIAPAKVYKGTVPDNQFEGHTRQAFEATKRLDGERIHICVCGEFFGTGEEAAEAAREHIKAAQGETSV